jgi:hypothetical protein
MTNFNNWKKKEQKEQKKLREQQRQLRRAKEQPDQEQEEKQQRQQLAEEEKSKQWNEQEKQNLLERHKQQNIVKLAQEIQTIEMSNSDLLNSLKSVDITNVTLNKLFLENLRSPSDLNFLQAVLSLDLNESLNRYGNEKMNLIKQFSECDFKKDEKHKPNLVNFFERCLVDGMLMTEISYYFAAINVGKDVLTCIDKLSETLKNVKINLFRDIVQRLQSQIVANENFPQAVEMINIQLKYNTNPLFIQYFDILFLNSRLEKNPDQRIMERLEAINLLASKNLNNLNFRDFKTIKTLLSYGHLAGKILNTYVSLSSMNILQYTAILTKYKCNLKQIKSLLEVNEEDKAVLLGMMDILSREHIPKWLLKSKDVERLIGNWPSLKFNEVPKLLSISQFLEENEIDINHYKTKVKAMGYENHEKFIRNDKNITGGDEDLIYVIKRIEPLMKLFVLGNDGIGGHLVKKGVSGIEDIKGIRQKETDGVEEVQSDNKKTIIN